MGIFSQAILRIPINQSGFNGMSTGQQGLVHVAHVFFTTLRDSTYFMLPLMPQKSLHFVSHRFCRNCQTLSGPWPRCFLSLMDIKNLKHFATVDPVECETVSLGLDKQFPKNPGTSKPVILRFQNHPLLYRFIHPLIGGSNR